MLVHMSKTKGVYRYNPISVNLSVEVAKTIFALAFLLFNVSLPSASHLSYTAHVRESCILLHLAERTVAASLPGKHQHAGYFIIARCPACIHVACV